ncbi:hypothetical protein CAC42_2427 [Sphaceloma murrayae]|uniref:Nucleoporin NUP192 n=1 Tax=Sphaceloma murrayae TaxID=2082308 RepID=A0A2K1QWB4_9PEZI|nr:hypothetical protein CAC42_2427 [Sphaceloma murrayae]
MEDLDSLTRLQGLQADLIAFSESRLQTVDRLWAELEYSIVDFRKLLDKRQKNENSRRAIQSDRITVEEVDYGINDEFRQEAIQVAEELDLDELDAAGLVLRTQQLNAELNRPPSLGSIIHFHENRELVLDALRLVLHQACDLDMEPDQRETLTRVVTFVLQDAPDKPIPRSTYWRRCLQGMEDIESWIRRLRDRLASIQVIGETTASATNVLEFQRGSLVRQHESLGMILRSLVSLGHTSIDDYKHLTTRLSLLDSFDELTVHYTLVLIEFPSVFGADGQASLRDARSMDQTFSDTTDATRWRLADFRGAAAVFWLAEYSGRYVDGINGSPLQNVNLHKEADARDDRVMAALRDGAFHFLLLVCSKIRTQQWHDPAKTGLVQFLLSDSRTERAAPLAISSAFEDVLSDQLQIFVESLISNMPDTIRRLKAEEDDQRRNLILSQSEQETSLHLERFMTIIAYAYEGDSAAALETFWTDRESNMYGFLKWSSKRQSTPRAAAFCEMFRAIAEDEKCSEKAHTFLLQGDIDVKARRGASLSWMQIFSELTFYAERLRESRGALTSYNEGPAERMSEPESALMLECYLRLATHMCGSSSDARHFLLSHPDFRLHEVLFDLCRSDIESRFKACAYFALAALMTDKTMEISYGMWSTFDEWICGIAGGRGGPPKLSPSQPTTETAMLARLRPIANGFEESNAFIRFLNSLVQLPSDQQELNDALPYPEQLGVNYRMIGIDQYADFVLGTLMTGILPSLEDSQQIWQLRCACLDFIFICLSSFNEDLVIFGNLTDINVDEAITTSSLISYVKLHPFARVMEWMFNDSVVAQLFAASHADPALLSGSSHDSPVVTSVARAVQVIDLILTKQVTYLDIVRPVVKMHSAARSRQVANPTLATFDDAILTDLKLVVDLGLYCSTAFESLTSLSLNLLQRLAQSRKLAGPVVRLGEGTSQPSRILAALQQADDVDLITASFIAPLQIEAREFELGVDSPGYGIKLSILDLLNKSLDVSTSRPGLAHCLLGFRCTDRTITIPQDSRFSTGQSLFHAIARLYAETASPEPVSTSLAVVRGKASEILRKLYKSPVTSELILAELRESGFNEEVAVSQVPVLSVTPRAVFEDKIEFLTSDSSLTFRDMIAERAAYFEHQALELRSATALQSSSLRDRTSSSVMGVTTIATGEKVQHATIFELFDFFDEHLVQTAQGPKLHYFKAINFGDFMMDDGNGERLYDKRMVKELILLHIADLRRRGELGPLDAPVEENEHLAACYDEAETLTMFLDALNRSHSINKTQRIACMAWVQLVSVMLTDGGLDGVQKTSFIIRALEVILPKVDIGLEGQSSFLVPLMRLVHNLVKHSSSTTTPVPADRLSAAFRTSLSCISLSSDSSDSTSQGSELREIAYQTASLILASPTTPLAREARRASESAGSRLLETVTDDVLASSPSLRNSSLLLLSSLVDLFSSQKSAYVIRSLSHSNFISTLTDNLRLIPTIFSSPRSKSDLDALLSTTRSSLALLLRIAKDTQGATRVLEAGLFSAVKESGLFTADPELAGEMMEGDAALVTFYGLLAGVLRVVAAVVTVKGERNEGVCTAARAFLTESRGCLLAVLKAVRKAEGLREQMREVLAEVLDGFQVVIWGTGFLDAEGTPTKAASGRLGMAFT